MLVKKKNYYEHRPCPIKFSIANLDLHAILATGLIPLSRAVLHVFSPLNSEIKYLTSLETKGELHLREYITHNRGYGTLETLRTTLCAQRTCRLKQTLGETRTC